MSEETTDTSTTTTLHISYSPSLTCPASNTMNVKRNVKRDTYANQSGHSTKLCNDSRCTVKRSTKYTKDQKKDQSNNSSEA